MSPAPPPSYAGLRVLSLESRRAPEIAALITSHGGNAFVAPSMREVPLGDHTAARAFADDVVAGRIDIVIFLTGVGTRTLMAAIAETRPTDAVLDALRKTRVVARGPKPTAVLRELRVPIWLTAPEPNTWRELLSALDERATERPLAGARIAVQEYGVANDELIDALAARGAVVTQVPVYRWALPEDTGPIEQAAGLLARREIDVALFTTRVQVTHLFQIAGRDSREDAVREGLRHAAVASIGPTTSEELRRYGVAPDLEPSHPKIGYLVRETAARAHEILDRKRSA
ncbi:MAG: uroporphyrinogen-III synthase [Acidimicrobiia bacterium]|nr:uroporphyrinogen-III synthase [Acidimicrobiia bacterium]